MARYARELGNYLKEGDAVATLVDLDPVIVVAHLTEIVEK